MNNSSAGSSSKQRTGSSQPSETSFKRKRGVFQKELQHMMYGFGDDPNVSEIILYYFCSNLYRKDSYVCFHGNSNMKISF
ncbi:hypothetical protein IC575_002537 [Cucumis melo]